VIGNNAFNDGAGATVARFSSPHRSISGFEEEIYVLEIQAIMLYPKNRDECSSFNTCW
jgi:hypothetical protein